LALRESDPEGWASQSMVPSSDEMGQSSRGDAPDGAGGQDGRNLPAMSESTDYGSLPVHPQSAAAHPSTDYGDFPDSDLP